MSASEVYQQIRQQLKECFGGKVDDSSLDRITLLVTGILRAQHAGPARVASALHEMGLRHASAESLERQVRRTENDPELTTEVCFHPFARQRLLWGRPQRLYLILDPTLQEDRIVMLTAAVWYRGRALPLAWATWKANTPLEGERFWERVKALLKQVAGLLPRGVRVVWLADRAFGTPAFTDLVIERGWDYVVRVQGQTLYRDRLGRECSVQSLAPQKGRRAKRAGQVFKKAGWRDAQVVTYWGRSYRSPLCLVSSLRTDWALIALYRRRYPIEATFRHYKAYGWQWEQGQVTDLEHMERLLIGMAIATWIVLAIGSRVAAEWLRHLPSGQRRTRPWAGKYSLFTLGLSRLKDGLNNTQPVDLVWMFGDWEGLNWSAQITFREARAFVFA